VRFKSFRALASSVHVLSKFVLVDVDITVLLANSYDLSLGGSLTVRIPELLLKVGAETIEVSLRTNSVVVGLVV